MASARYRHISTNTTAGVNDGQGTRFLPNGTDDVPDESKGVADSSTRFSPCACGRSPVEHTMGPELPTDGTCVPGLHECVFAEEREPSGRLVLPPCLVCGLAAMDAIEELRRRSSLRSVGGIAESGTDDELDLD